MRIDLPCYNQRTHRFDFLVEAEIIDIAPHLADVATFAVYCCPWDSGEWRVASVETSATVARYCPTRREAVRRARARLAEKTIAETMEAMAAQQKIWRENGAEGVTC